MIGDRAGTRTQDLQIKSPLLYQLSYAISGPLRPPLHSGPTDQPQANETGGPNFGPKAASTVSGSRDVTPTQSAR